MRKRFVDELEGRLMLALYLPLSFSVCSTKRNAYRECEREKHREKCKVKAAGKVFQFVYAGNAELSELLH